MSLDNIWSYKNLLLAWRRITAGRNIAYKRYFRKLYYAYEIGLDFNIKDLSRRLSGGSYNAQQPTRVYVPKPSGLQRPITLLYIEDQIVLQAIANVFAGKVSYRRQKLEHKYVFSNIIQHEQDSIFFLQDWKVSYSLFQKKIEEFYNAGYRWIAHFDLAAYYDTICHDMLFRSVFPKSVGRNRDRIIDYFKKWSSEKQVSSHAHGIPQGPIGSDFFAECFLLPVDEALQKQKFQFVRYVDDIRLFAKTENDARLATVQMEVLMRERGLIPQGKKQAIGFAKILKDAMGILPSIDPRNENDSNDETLISPSKALQSFQIALSGRPLTITDKTRARYILYHATPSQKVLNYVLLLMPRHPEHIDAFVSYLFRHKRSRRILKKCVDLSKTSPYEYVQGEMWHIMARMMRPSEMKYVISRAVDIAKNKKTGLALKWGALHFLCMAEQKGIGNYSKFLQYQDNALLQALLVPILPDTRYAKGDVADEMLRRKVFEPGICLAEEFVRLGKTHLSYDLKVDNLPSQVRNTFRVLGLVKQPLPVVDPMGEILSQRYGISQWGKWQILFGREYSHALQLLAIADAAYNMGRSQWLSHQNSFNNSLFLVFQKWLNRKNLPGVVKTIDKHGNQVKFGNLVDPQNNFAQNYPIIAASFKKANTRRNSLPGSHPYEIAGGKRTHYLRQREQVNITKELGKAYAEIVNVVKSKSP